MAKITKDMTIAEVLAMDNDSAMVFFESGMHCVGCPASSGESIEEASEVHGIDADALVNKLNDYFENKK
jgi:hybrid cluster-associated redox disulfide protein